MHDCVSDSQTAHQPREGVAESCCCIGPPLTLSDTHSDTCRHVTPETHCAKCRTVTHAGAPKATNDQGKLQPNQCRRVPLLLPPNWKPSLQPLDPIGLHLPHPRDHKPLPEEAPMAAQPAPPRGQAETNASNGSQDPQQLPSPHRAAATTRLRPSATHVT